MARHLQLNKKVRTTFTVILLTFVLVGAWYYQVVWNTVKPTIIRSFPTINAAASTSYSSDQSMLNYPELGIAAPLTNEPGVSPFNIEDWSSLRADLSHGIALTYSGDSFANAPYAYLIGHSSDVYPHPYSAVFAGLGQAKVGDTFLVVVKGVPYTYTVRAIQIVQPTRIKTFEAPGIFAEQNHTHFISLVTCWPVLTTRNRLMVVAERKT